MSRRSEMMAAMKGDAGATPPAPVAQAPAPASAATPPAPPTAARPPSALPPRLQSAEPAPAPEPPAVPPGPSVADLEAKLQAREAELDAARKESMRLQGLEPALKYLYEPGVIEAVERIRQGQVAPVAPRQAPTLPDEVADMTRAQLDEYYAHREEQLVARLEAALEKRDRAMEARLRATHDKELIRARVGIDAETLERVEAEFQSMNGVDRAVIALEGYFAKNPGVVKARGAGPAAHTAPAAPLPAALPGPLAITGGPQATTADALQLRKNAFLAQWDDPRARALAEMKS